MPARRAATSAEPRPGPGAGCRRERARAGLGPEPSSHGKRVAFDGRDRTVIDGPFAGTENLVAGFRLWKVEDMAQAVDWVKRCPDPMPGPSGIEIRPLFEMSDFAGIARASVPPETSAERAGTRGQRGRAAVGR